MPEYPILLILHSLQKKLAEWIERRLAGKAIINVLIVLVCFEPEFIGVVKEYPAKKEKSEKEDQGRFVQFGY